MLDDQSFSLGAPGSSPAPEATLERGGPRDNPRELAVHLRNRHLAHRTLRPSLLPLLTVL